jgi:hypothetical protein
MDTVTLREILAELRKANETLGMIKIIQSNHFYRLERMDERIKEDMERREAAHGEDNAERNKFIARLADSMEKCAVELKKGNDFLDRPLTAVCAKCGWEVKPGGLSCPCGALGRSGTGDGIVARGGEETGQQTAERSRGSTRDGATLRSPSPCIPCPATPNDPVNDACTCDDEHCFSCGGQCERQGLHMMHPARGNDSDKHPWLCRSCLAYWMGKREYEVCRH